ncbi:MAG: hypothetical protein ACJ8MR_03685, partial [Povalibacter sp.]
DAVDPERLINQAAWSGDLPAFDIGVVMDHALGRSQLLRAVWEFYFYRKARIAKGGALPEDVVAICTVRILTGFAQL